MVAALAGAWVLAAPALTEAAAERGQYLLAAAGCVSCHTEDRDGAPALAGGRALATPFGTFYSPNITPDRETGIGRWSEADFVTALREGTGPGGEHYFPVFPYPAYAGMSREDAVAIWAHLRSLAPVKRANRAHDLPWYLGTRLAAAAWKLLFFRSQRFAPDPERSGEWNRGAYLVRHLGHCGECHTPRNAFGAPESGAELAGNPDGPEDKRVPNITPDPASGIGDWTTSDIETFLEIGMLPDGDFAGAGMGEVIDDNTSQLTPGDRRAIATYLQSVPAQASRAGHGGDT